jgi:hypothetical protein
MIILPIAIVVSIGAVWTLSPRGISGTRKTDVVDGSHNPKAIPDRIAYSLMLRLITDQEDIRILSATAEKFKQKVDELDAKVSAIKKLESESRAPRLPETQQQLRQFRAQFDGAVEEAVSSISHDMSKPGLDQLKHFMDLKFKAKVKLRADGAS